MFGAQLIEYENGLDYAAKLSTPAYFQGYTAIPLGNAPRLPSRRWANGMLNGAKEAGTGDPAKRGSAKAHEKTRKPKEGIITQAQEISFLGPAI